MLDFASKENSFQTKVNPTTNTVQKKELVNNSSESVYDNLKSGINTIQMKQTSNSSTIQFVDKQYNFKETKSNKGRGKLGRIFKGGILGAMATHQGGYGSEEERRKEEPQYYNNYKGKDDSRKIDINKEAIEIDIPGKKRGSTNKLRGYKYNPEKEKNGKAVILFSGSAGSNISQMLPIAKEYVTQGYVCYGIDYRGFGKSGKEIKSGKYSSGMISENRIYEDARIIYNYVLGEGYSPNNIILHGFSLGGAVASNLAVEISQKAQDGGNDYKLGGLVMHSPMTSTSEMGRSVGKAMLGGIGGALGSIKTKGAMGSMSTKKNLKKLRELDADLPLAFMSGLEGYDDHLDYKKTKIANSFLGEDEQIENDPLKEQVLQIGNVILNARTYAGHLKTNQFTDPKVHMKHIKEWKDMDRSNTAQQKSIDSANSSYGNGTVQKKSNDTGLPNNLKYSIESLSGYSMNDVKVHYNSPKPAQMKALAYTQGTDIHVAPGQEKHLGHEAWHVVQQKQGRVQPTTQMKGLNINDNASLEHEADIMGAKATQLKAANNAATVQRFAVMKNDIA